MSKVAYLSLSGGLDSTTLLYFLKNEGFEVRPVFFDYGSKHNSYEYFAACVILSAAQMDRPRVINLAQTGIFSGNDSALLAQNGRPIPTEAYSAPGSLAATVVPGRNLIMASILASMAECEARRIDEQVVVALGVHAGDHALYPDCRPAFVQNLDSTIQLSTECMVRLLCPFMRKSKAEIVKIGHELGVPFEFTRSCYKQQEKSCGQCGTCRERLAAFAENGLQDPIQYAAN